MKELSPEKIQENWETFRNFINKLKNKDSINLMLNDLEDRMILTPASSRLDRHLAVPGGLIDHSLRVMNNAMIISKKFFSEFNISTDSIVLCSLLHDIGKVGSEIKDYYVQQESNWHREKLGEMYKVSQELSFMSHAQRSIYLLQHYNIKLSEEEYLAILTHDGPYAKENEMFNMKESPLTVCIQLGDLLACKQEKILFG